jgi:hypothetical protein
LAFSVNQICLPDDALQFTATPFFFFLFPPPEFHFLELKYFIPMFPLWTLVASSSHDQITTTTTTTTTIIFIKLQLLCSIVMDGLIIFTSQ